MEFHQLEYFLAIIQYKTISNAANALSISQPAMTRAIQKLESELGFPLFDRINNRLVLNDYGELALEYAKNILSQKDKMLETLDNYHKSKISITIGSCAPAPLWGIKYICHELYPQVSIDTLISNDNIDLIEKFNNKELSLLILDYPINKQDIISQKVLSETLYIAANKDDPLAKKTSITFKELDGTNILLLSKTGYWHDVCKEMLPHSLLLVQDDIATYSALIKASSLPTFRTNITIDKFKNIEDKVYIPITDQSATLSFYLNYHIKDKNLYNPITSKLSSIPWNQYRNEDPF